MHEWGHPTSGRYPSVCVCPPSFVQFPLDHPPDRAECRAGVRLHKWLYNFRRAPGELGGLILSDSSSGPT